jgi:hypothetical protein
MYAAVIGKVKEHPFGVDVGGGHAGTQFDPGSAGDG